MSEFRNPLKTALGLGSAKYGVSHFVNQRLTAIALVFLGLYFLGLVICGAQGGYDVVHGAIAHPVNAVLVVAFVVAMCWHAALGVQTVIEDYVHSGWGIALQILNRFVFAVTAIAGVFAVVRIALGN
ncbi:succinate dehydrogenase, hydrophobic membrane anchor protein [Solilutibacter silvestris]|uniref:Succinate dehydrogenase hydrophobic membrane anchor subunit n=1 Tax=Solilutibacter silvestris TaxID=1645665 RepID=A0A2K1PYQ0_9GAMM|nr:succinate dehydrogenase, hydrophobic membrane anchor protein [Lysobacter silvestris]PNS07797.1 succinate dehydrogenase [Lysobacter silvestris]